MIIKDATHQLVEPCSVVVINKAVIVDAEDLVDKQADYSALVLQRFFLQQQATLDNT